MLELPEMDPCIFCEGIAGRRYDWLPLEEAELTLTVLTDTQFEVGQSLVIPRRHAPTLLDLTEEESVAVMLAARRLMKAVLEAFSPKGILLYQNNGVWSGQEVPHFHLHVVPRQPGSEWGVGPPHIARLEAGERSAARVPPPIDVRRMTAGRIKAQLGH